MIISHTIATPEACRKGPATGKLYEYILAGNGVYLRARRDNLAAQFPVVQTQRPIAGLQALRTAIGLPKKVPGCYLSAILDASKIALPDEMLCYLSFDGARWSLYIPSQEATPGSVNPLDPFDPAAAAALIEVHSHNHMPAFFSRDDDRDETGFRLYVVIGRVDQSYPEINARVGVYGNTAPVPARMIFNDLGRFIDVNER